jgi:hypothetical protein
MPTPHQIQAKEELMLEIQGLILLLEKVRANKSIIELDGNKTESNFTLIVSYNKTMRQIELLKLDKIEKLIKFN